MFSITVITVEQQAAFAVKQYTAYLQRHDSILAGCMRNLCKVSRLLGKYVQQVLAAQSASQILLNSGRFSSHYHFKSQSGGAEGFKAYRESK